MSNKVVYLSVLLVGFLDVPNFCETKPAVLREDAIERESTPPEGHSFSYKTLDSERTEQLTLHKVGENEDVPKIEGTYRFTTPDGSTFTVTFKADENGYIPKIFFGHNVPSTVGINLGEDTPSQVIIGSGAIVSLTGGGLG